MRIDTDKIHSREKFELSWVNYLFSQNILKVTCLYMYAMNLLFIVSLIYNNIYREKYVCLSVRPSMVSASLFQSQSLSPSCITYRQNKQTNVILFRRSVTKNVTQNKKTCENSDNFFADLNGILGPYTHRSLLRFWPKPKMRRNPPTKTRAILNTYG